MLSLVDVLSAALQEKSCQQVQLRPFAVPPNFGNELTPPLQCDSGRFGDVPITMSVTPQYASPEVIRGYCDNDEEQIDVPAHDIWSLGVILLELITGIAMFSTRPMGAVVCQHAAVRSLHDKRVSAAPIIHELFPHGGQRRGIECSVECSQCLHHCTTDCLPAVSQLQIKCMGTA